MKESKKLTTLLYSSIAGVVIGLLIGFGFSRDLINQNSDQNSTTSNQQTEETKKEENKTPISISKASDLRLLLNNMERQHVNLAAQAVQTKYDGEYVGTHDVVLTAKFEALAHNLHGNSSDISGAIGSLYGKEAGDAFLKVWSSHIDYLLDYTDALKNKDKAGQDKAVADLGIYIENASEFLSKANPNLPKDALKKMLTDHVMHLKAVVDNYASGNFKEAYTAHEAAFNHVGTIADGMSEAIVKQFPDKFITLDEKQSLHE